MTSFYLLHISKRLQLQSLKDYSCNVLMGKKKKKKGRGEDWGSLKLFMVDSSLACQNGSYFPHVLKENVPGILSACDPVHLAIVPEVKHIARVNTMKENMLFQEL